jgi:hypothetical protein
LAFQEKKEVSMTRTVCAVFLFFWSQFFLASAFQPAVLSQTRDSVSLLCALSAEGEGHDVSMVEKCFDAFNQRDLKGIMECFEEDCAYEDTLFDGGASDKKELQGRFQRALDTAPLKVIVLPRERLEPGGIWKRNLAIHFPFPRDVPFTQQTWKRERSRLDFESWKHP